MTPPLTPAAAADWAQHTFGSAQLGDKRRPARAVQLGTAMLANPAASLPRQLPTPAALEATYDLLHQADVTHAGVLTPHWEQTRELARQHPLVLLTGDLTTLDYSHHPTTTGLGPIGNGRGRGYLVHSVLALLPAPRQVLGLAHQIPYVPPPKRTGETLRQMQARRRQTDVWQEAVEAIGAPPQGVRWVHVGDRGSDIFRFLEACQTHHCDFLVRACKDRRVAEATDDPAEEEAISRLFTAVRSWPSQGERTIEVPASHGHVARTTEVVVSWEAVVLQQPRQEPAEGPITAWVVRVWEPHPPAGVKEPIDWVLLTSVPVTSLEEAWERVAWYRARWTNEDYHQCLKTGCGIEQRNLGDQPALERLLAFCAPVAIVLLQLRDVARIEPERPATEVVAAELVRLVALLSGQVPAAMTIRDFWYAVARRGGYLGRKRDGPPGWKTLWLGWYDVQRILEGVRLAPQLAPPEN
jgi:Transposase DNA-binding/Transposase Tn5 dimerisation domain